MKPFAKAAMLAFVGIALSLTGTFAFDLVEAPREQQSTPQPPDFPIDVSNPMPVDVPRAHIDPKSAPQLAHYAHNGDVDDVVLGKDKPGLRLDQAGAAALLGGLDCRIDRGDLLLANLGADIADGAKVKWRAAGDRGAIALPHGLRTGQVARVDDVVSLNSGDCSAEVI